MVVIKEMNSKGKIMQITGKDAKKRVNATYDKLIENLNPKIAKEKDVYKEKLEKIEEKLEKNTRAILRIKKMLKNLTAS